MSDSRLCNLHLAEGREEPCPGAACAFWEAGGAVVEPGCAFDRVSLELEGRPHVARWLLGIRRELEGGRRIAQSAFLPPGLHD
jgi:hypothetical protein